MAENQTIEKIDFSESSLEKEYLDCMFIDCNFEQQQLNQITFEECHFEQCNFSLIKTNKTSWHNACFNACKMVGADFTGSNPFSTFRFENSNLQYIIFTQMKLKGTYFIKCNLQEADFNDTDLSSAIFDECDLLRAIFYNTNLENADLTSAYYFIIDPRINRLKNAHFSMNGLEGLVASFGVIIK